VRRGGTPADGAEQRGEVRAHRRHDDGGPLGEEAALVLGRQVLVGGNARLLVAKPRDSRLGIRLQRVQRGQ